MGSEQKFVLELKIPQDVRKFFTNRDGEDTITPDKEKKLLKLSTRLPPEDAQMLQRAMKKSAETFDKRIWDILHHKADNNEDSG